MPLIQVNRGCFIGNPKVSLWHGYLVHQETTLFIVNFVFDLVQQINRFDRRKVIYIGLGEFFEDGFVILSISSVFAANPLR